MQKNYINYNMSGQTVEIKIRIVVIHNPFLSLHISYT